MYGKKYKEKLVNSYLKLPKEKLVELLIAQREKTTRKNHMLKQAEKNPMAQGRGWIMEDKRVVQPEPIITTTATKNVKTKYIKLPEDKGIPTFYSPRVSMPKTIKELAEEFVKKIYVKNTGDDFLARYLIENNKLSNEIKQFVQDLLTLISECVGGMEQVIERQGHPEDRKDEINVMIIGRNNLRDKMNSAISERSGI